MLEKEKEAIQQANKLINFDDNLIGWQNGKYPQNGDEFTKEHLKILLNYIDELQDELQEENEKSKFWHDSYYELKQKCEDEGIKLGF